MTHASRNATSSLGKKRYVVLLCEGGQRFWVCRASCHHLDEPWRLRPWQVHRCGSAPSHTALGGHNGADFFLIQAFIKVRVDTP